jgi:plastocyanin
MLKHTNIFKFLLASVCIIAASFTTANASDIMVSVTDQSGEALSGAVVYVERLDGKPIDWQTDDAVKIIDQKGEAFSPFVTALSTGDSLEFHNTDPITHHVYSFSKTKPINIIVPARQNSEAFTFDEAGVVALGCNIHDHMAAFIYVSPSPVTGISGEDGKVSISGLPDGDYMLAYWHHRVPRSQTKSKEVSIAGNTELAIEIKVRRERKNSKRRRTDERPY